MFFIILFIVFFVVFGLIVSIIIKVTKGVFSGIKNTINTQKNISSEPVHQPNLTVTCEYCSTSQLVKNFKCASCGARLPK